MSDINSSTERTPLDIATVGLDTFRPHAGSSFQMQAGNSEPVDATLEELEELTNHGPSDGAEKQRSPYSLLFKCGVGGAPQGMYSLTHSELGSIDLFLVPVGGDAESTQLEAVIN